jgi:peptide-methionine (S)-S-oxide reductase
MSFLTKLFRPFTTSTMSSGPATPMTAPAGAQTATVAAGCFWGVEHMYRRQFENKGLYDARVGYIGGDSENPSYRAVCSGRTGRKSKIPFIWETGMEMGRWWYKLYGLEC